jgi:hypothetical protein
MTPARLLVYLLVLCKDPTKTTAQIKAALALVKTSAMSNPDGPARGHDVAYYCDVVTTLITSLETTVPPWPAEEIKAQIAGRASGLIPTA